MLPKSNLDFNAKDAARIIVPVLVPPPPPPKPEPQPKKPVPPRQKEKLSPAVIEAQAQNIFTFTTQFDVNMWAVEKEIVRQVYDQIKSLRSDLTNVISDSADQPEVDLTNLLNLNTKLGDLQDLIAKASKGDRAAAGRIPLVADPNAAAGAVLPGEGMA